MMHAASGKPTRARSTGHLGGDCGPGAAEGGRAASRSIFASCSLKRASCSSARTICSWASASRSSARATEASCGSLAFGVGVEFIGVSLFRPMSSEGGGRLSVRSTRWKNPGSYGDSVPESLSAAQPKGAAPRRLSPSRRSFPLVLIYLSGGRPSQSREAKHTGGPGGQVYAPSLHERTTIIYPDGDASPGGM